VLTAVVANFCNTQGPLSPAAVGGYTAEVDTLILLDRAVDLVTPLCTQLTYEGLIDEVLGISNGSVELTTLADQEGALAVRPNAPFVIYDCCAVRPSDSVGLVGGGSALTRHGSTRQIPSSGSLEISTSGARVSVCARSPSPFNRITRF
jgi:hypothetical protein